MICTFITYYTTTTILKVKSSGITMFLCNLLLFPKQSPPFFCKLNIRVRPRFFDQVGHQTTNAAIENKYFFTKWCHRQTHQNYEQSWQKLGSFLVNKVLKKSKFSKKFINISWSSNQIFFTEFFFWKIWPILDT